MFKKKKAPSRRAPYLHPSKSQYDAWTWCINNKVGVCVVPDWPNAGKWKIEIVMNEKTSVDPNSYDGIEALTKMYEYCKYYKNKYENTL